LLETYHTPESFLATYLSSNSEDDFFGNLLPSANRYIRWNKMHYKVFKQEGPVRRKVRKRGYDDKGTFRPLHQRGRNLPSMSIDREDRRSFICHPLSKFSDGVLADKLILTERRNTHGDSAREHKKEQPSETRDEEN